MPLLPGTLPAFGVLLLDANPARAAALAGGLKSGGLRVTTASSVDEAARASTGEAFLGFLVDCELLRSHVEPIGRSIEARGGRLSPLIALADSPFDPALQEAARRHGAALLPFPRGDLKQLLQYLLDLPTPEGEDRDEVSTTPLALAARLLPTPRPLTAPDGTVLAFEHTDQPEAPLVLVIDDSASARARLAQVLSRRRLRVVSCDRADRALRFLELHREVALVVSDLHMPEMNGLLLKDRLTRLGIQVPFVLTTSTPGEETLTLARKLEVAAVLAKPTADPAEFLAEVEKVLPKPPH